MTAKTHRPCYADRGAWFEVRCMVRFLRLRKAWDSRLSGGCIWLRGNVIHYNFICFFNQHLKTLNKIFTIQYREWPENFIILHSLGLWRYQVWSCQGGFERGSLPDIQQAYSKEAEGIPVGLENEGKPASVCRNSSRRPQKKEAKKPTLCRTSNKVLA